MTVNHKTSFVSYKNAMKNKILKDASVFVQNGATTLGIMTFNLTTFRIVALCKAITKSINHINDRVRERMRKIKD
jgi:hypothetical protein